MKRSTIIIGSAVIVVGCTALFFTGPAVKGEVIPTIAESDASAIERYMESFAAGQKKQEQGRSLTEEGARMMDEATTAARGRDIALCAEFKLRYDRTSRKLIHDPACASLF